MLLKRCSEGEQTMFKRMYGKPGDLSLPIDEVIEKINPDRIDWAITQVENTIAKKNVNTVN